MKIEPYNPSLQVKEYKEWKKMMEQERLERLAKKKKRQKAIEEMKFLKSQARKEYNTNIHKTGTMGPISRKEIEAYEIQQMLMSEM